MVLLLSILMLLLGTGLAPASANTPNNQKKTVNLTLSEWNDRAGNRGRYNVAITEIRRAAGEEIRPNSNIWQSMGTAVSAGLIEVNVWDEGGSLVISFFLNPQNLYIGGFRARGQTFLFGDASTNIRDEVARHYGPAVVMAQEGSYFRLLAELSGPGRPGEPTKMNIHSLLGSMQRLNSVTADEVNTEPTRQNIATDMMRVIGMFAEGARFPHFRDRFGLALNNVKTDVITPTLQTLRLKWGKISDWARQFNRNPGGTAPLHIANVGTFAVWADLVLWLRVVNGRSPNQSV
jgi:hypothetical protein